MLISNQVASAKKWCFSQN